MAAPDVYSSFMSGFSESYGMASKMKSEREKSALTKAATLVSGVDDWKEVKADRDLMLTQAQQMVEELDLNKDGTNAALKEVYKRLEANQTSKERYKVVKEALVDSGTTSFSLDPNYKPEETEVDAQTEEAIPGVKNPDNQLTPDKKEVVDTGLGKVVEEKETTDNPEQSNLKKKFLGLFDSEGRIDSRALEIASEAVGGDDILSEYRAYQTTGKLPTLAEFADLPAAASIVTGYATPLGKGWNLKSIGKELGAPEEKYALIQFLGDDPKNAEAVEYLTRLRDEQIATTRLAGMKDGTTSHEEISNAVEFNFLQDNGVYNTDGSANLEAFDGNYKTWKREKDRLLNTFKESVFGSTLAEVTSVTSATIALGKISSLVTAGELTDAEAGELTTTISNMKANLEADERRKADLSKKPAAFSDQIKLSAIDPNGNSLGVYHIDSITGKKTLNGKEIGDTINGVSYVGVPPEQVSNFATKIKEIGPDFNTKRQGFTAFLNRVQKLRDLVEADPDVLLSFGTVAKGATSIARNVDFFVDALLNDQNIAKTHNMDVGGINKYLASSDRKTLLSLLPEDIVELSANQSKFVSLRIQSAYALAQALGQEGKGLSDTDLQLQLRSISGSTGIDAFMDMTASIVGNLYDSVDNERKAYVNSINGIGLNVSLIDLMAENDPNFLRSDTLINASGVELIEISLEVAKRKREAKKKARSSAQVDAAGNANVNVKEETKDELNKRLRAKYGLTP